VNVTSWGSPNNSALAPVVEDLNGAAQATLPPRQDDSDASHLARAIREMHGRTVLESDVVECAQGAVAEACAFVDRELPKARVIAPLTTSLGPFVGIACTNVSALCELDYTVDKTSGRAVCVTDKVTPMDYDAHAALAIPRARML
jgi:hypothetical protein